jgi:hypothetical protein
MNAYVAVGTGTLVATLIGLFGKAAYAIERRAGGSLQQAKRAALGIVAGQSLWVALTGIAALGGAYANFYEVPPKLPITLLVSIVLIIVFSRSTQYAKALKFAPLAWPIAVQSMRLFIEVGLWQLHRDGQLPVHLTFEGYNFDVLVGLTAPAVALGVAQGWIGKRGAIAWNVASVILLITIVFMAITSAPGPQHLPWPGDPNTILGQFPSVWLPTFFVPIAVFAHVTSLRQLFSLRSMPAAGGSDARLTQTKSHCCLVANDDD